MRIVDVNALLPGPGGGPAADEKWAIQARERLLAPADDEPGAWPSTVGLRRQLVVLPGDLDRLQRRLDRYRDDGAPAVVRICPGRARHRYPLVAWALGAIPELLEREGWALALDMVADGAYPWVDVVSFAQQHSSLPCVVLGAPLDDRTAGAALDATANLILETSAVRDAPTLETLAALVRSRGAHRFVHGSGERPPGAPAAWGQLAADEALMLASGTADLLDAGAWASTYL